MGGVEHQKNRKIKIVQAVGSGGERKKNKGNLCPAKKGWATKLAEEGTDLVRGMPCLAGGKGGWMSDLGGVWWCFKKAHKGATPMAIAGTL